jgi:hypothetical protein
LPGSFVYLSMGGKKWFTQKPPAGAPPLPNSFWFHPMTIASPPAENIENNTFSIVLQVSGDTAQANGVEKRQATWSEMIYNMVKQKTAVGGETPDFSDVFPHTGGPCGYIDTTCFFNNSSTLLINIFINKSCV